MSVGFSIASFELPNDVARAISGSASNSRGIYVTSTTTPDVVGLAIHPIPSGYRHICLHRHTNAPKLAGKLAAIVHGGKPELRLTCALEPGRDPLTLYGDRDGWLWLTGKSGDTSSKLLDRERVTTMWGWLLEWIRIGDQRHSIARRGVYRSIEEEEREERALREEMRQAQLAIDDGDHSFESAWDREANTVVYRAFSTT